MIKRKRKYFAETEISQNYEKPIRKKINTLHVNIVIPRII